ncbi:MAG: hypothetical protein C0481_12360 [Phenylobacterium sp.]|uniref:HXXEE domain-containing protein n=1 Tax=Phenylobacterium sp. TaxID=1871053 RepID=UPI0025CE7F3D|nr:HXXEE domain-containing protein [Phenylobacterium sp.]MBA4012653.1 hypothetical protein [Phenylobacterium sp.]
MGSRRTAGLALIAALALHNLEEGLAYALLGGHVEAMLDSYHLTWWRPDPAVFALLLTAITLAIGLLAAWAATGSVTSAKVITLRAVAVVLLLNVPVPHVTAAWAFGGYAPGVLTAVLINLPVSIWVLWTLRAAPQPE